MRTKSSQGRDGRLQPVGGARVVWLAVLLLVSSEMDVHAEAPAERPGPRIGLALSGGGARGIAHVGVIRLLEELNVQVDYIAGTSMGSIVAGLYAAGYTSEEMVEWLDECDWDLLLSDSIPREQRGYRAKAEELDTPRWIEFGVDWKGLKVPNAFISGQNLLVALREKTFFVGSQQSFDDLPVPYRAVATDLETGDMVVLDRGSLADAMRASMAVPGVFAPYTIDGRILIDGFASRNLPVSVVREMGADVVIAVDVRAELLPAGELNNPVSVAEQLLSILSQRDTLQQIDSLTKTDILVRLKLPGFASSSFAQALDIAELGYVEAQDARPSLTRLALPADVYAASEQSRSRLRRTLPIIAAIEVEGTGRVSESAVRKRLKLQPGERLDPERLRDSLGRVYDIGYFKSVDYRIEDRPEGAVLIVTTEPKPWGPNFALFGLNLGSDLDGSTQLNARASLRFTQLNRLGAELAVGASVGTIDRLDLEFFQPIEDTGTFFVAPEGDFLRKPEGYLVDLSSLIPDLPLQQITFQRQELFGGLATGLRIGSYGEFRVGMEYGSIKNTDVQAPSIVVIGPDGEIEIIDLASVFFDYETSRFYGALTLDRLDDAFFPRHGYFVNWLIDHETGTYGNTVSSLQATAPVALGDFVIQPRLSMNHTLQEAENSARLPFTVGGLFNLSGIPTDEVFGSNSFVGTLVIRKRLGGGDSTKGLFVGGSIEVGNTWDDNDRYFPEDWILAGSAFVATSTPIGPIHLALGLADGFSPTFYLYLGRVIP